MGKRILLIQGHPDASEAHLCHALEDGYARGASGAGHEVRRIDVARIEFPILRSQRAWEAGDLAPALYAAQESMEWAQHIVLLFPLWLGDMPALLKAFLEQVARPGFAFDREQANPFRAGRLRGRSAHVVVTMGMPAALYRWYFRSHSVRSLERNILRMIGISPVTVTMIGGVGNMTAERAAQWIENLKTAGARGN